MSGTQPTPFGRALRHWRRLRGVSQLALAAAAATTTRHVSYLETGRSRPSREMVDRLGDALEVPLRERNRMLELAGLAGVYPEGDLAADDLLPFRRVVDRLLRTHEPYPAFVVDRYWNVIDANQAAQMFLPDATGPNTARLLLDAWRPLIENWDEVAVAVVDRIAADLARYPDDETLLELHRSVAAAAGETHISTGRAAARVVCPRFRINGQLVRTLTVVARFESAVDVTLDELRVELVYPEDDASDRFFQQVARQRHSAAVTGSRATSSVDDAPSRAAPRA